MSDNKKTPISLDSIDEQRKLLEAQEMLQVNSLLKSTDPADIVKAQTYLQGIQKRQDNNFKSFVFSPEQEFYNSLGYKNQPTPTSYQTLRNMSRTVIMRSIITTRVDQVASFSEPTSDEQKVGWTIRKKRGIFDTKETKITEEDKRKIEDIIQFMLDSGINQNTWTNDNFDQFLRKITLDSLVLDQMTFECVRNRRGQLVEYIATDGGTMRLAEGYDDRNERVVGEFAEEINGYKPSYVQVYNQQVKNIYYPWELCFGIRNQTTSIQNNGYGISELEDLITIITYMLYGQLYNGNFFKQGSNPKGLLHIKGNLDAAKMAEFKQMWRSTVSGVSNAHKMPVLDGGNDIQFIDMQHSNKDMEFSQWQDFLTVVACSVYKIDPSEIGFNLQKGSSVFGQDGQKARLEHSQSKGLAPLLKFIQRKLTKYIVSQLDPKFEFVFTGIEQEDKIAALDMDVKKSSAGFVSQEDMFKKYSSRDFNPDKDTILNPVYLQAQQMKQMGGQGSNEEVDNQTGETEGNSYNEDENPFAKSMNDYIDKQFTQEKIQL